MTLSNWINFLLLIVSIIAAAIAWRAVFAARASAKEANDIQRRILAIEEAREQERRSANLRTELRCHRIKAGRGYKLIIENRGPSKAREIRIAVNGIDIAQHEAFNVDSWAEVRRMSTTLNSDEQIVLRYGPPDSPEGVVSTIFITWLNEDDSNGQFETNV